MRIFIKNLFVFLSFTYFILLVLDYSFTSVYKKGSYYKTQWLFNKKNQSYDFAILGNSRPYTAIDTKKVNEMTGQNGINLSLDGSNTPTHALALKMFLERNNRIKRLYLNQDFHEIHTKEVGNFSYPRFMPYFKEKLAKEHYKEFGLKWKIYAYIPFIRYAEQNSAWGIHQLINSMTNFKKPKFDNLGTKIYTETDYHGTRELGDYVYDTLGFMGYFNDMVKTCEYNDIELIVFTCPLANVRASDVYYEGIKSFESYLAKREIPYYNFGIKYNLQFDLFVDRDHLNKYGVELFSEDVAQMILQTSN